MFTVYNQGKAFPLGATQYHETQAVKNGKSFTNFALFSSAATAVELCLFDGQKETRLPMVCTNNIWHLAVLGVKTGTEYGFRIHGESANPQKLMLDPYAKAVNGKPDLSTPEAKSWFLLNDPRDNVALAPKAVVVEIQFDWTGDCASNIPWANSIIYELHVKGFSKLNTNIPETLRGTYAGLAHPTNLAYFKALGITAVELLPINFFIDEPHLQAKNLQNYWGYNPLAMFAVEPKYAATDNPLTEFKQMVKALHQAGIEVILDVVFNHTAESEKDFPTFSQRGIDDAHYYWQNTQGEYLNATGCGNTLNLASDAGRQWFIDCLRYWVEDCHVDGFRFDLATVLGRATPDFHAQAALFEKLANDPILQKVKLIAEPWDIGYGGYQVGQFPAYFAEWNDRFRDDMNRFWLWQSGALGAFAERFAGSSDLFAKNDRLPHTSVNFITAHDGFTLRDLVSYNTKHNEANGEENLDGRNENYSYNHGFEGNEIPSSEPNKSTIEQNRFITQASLLMTLLLANGTPMLLAGDEFGHSQQGNNNAYCQDNEITWLNWANFNQPLFNFTAQTIALRKQIASLTADRWWHNGNVQWLNIHGQPMEIANWQDSNTKAFQILLDNRYLLLINGKTVPQTFLLPNQFDWEVVLSSHDITCSSHHFETSDKTFCVLQVKDF